MPRSPLREWLSVNNFVDPGGVELANSGFFVEAIVAIENADVVEIVSARSLDD